MGERAEMISISVDQDLCMGSGYCLKVDPRLFDVNVEGIAELRSADPPRSMGGGPVMLRPDQVDAARQASDTCPAAAIIVHED